MADKKLNENQLPSCSVLSDITYQKLHNVKKNVTKKRQLSELEDQYEINYPNKQRRNVKNKFKKNKIYLSDALGISLPESSIDAINAQNDEMSFDSKIVGGQQEKLSESIQYLGDKTLLDVNNSFSVNRDKYEKNNSKITLNQENETSILSLKVKDYVSSEQKNETNVYIKEEFNENDFDPVEKSNYPLKNNDDIILLNEEVDTFISHNDETYKSYSMIINNQEDSQKLKKSVRSIIILDNEKNINKICDVNESSNTKSIYGQEEKLSESIQYLKKKTVLKDTNISFFVNENKKNDNLFDQELSKPSNNLYDIVTLDDENIHLTKINHQISKSGDSVSTDILIDPIKRVDDLIMLDNEHFDCCIIEKQKKVLELSGKEIDVIQSSKNDEINKTCEDTFHKTSSTNIDEENIIDLTAYSNNEIMLHNDNGIISTSTYNEINACDSCKNHKEFHKTSISSHDVIFLDGNVCSTNINNIKTNKSSSSIANLRKAYILDLSKNVEDTILISDDENNIDDISPNEKDEKICESSSKTSEEHLINENQVQNDQNIDSSFESSISSIRCNLNINNFTNEAVIESQHFSLESNDKNVSFTPIEVKKSHESSNSHSEASDISLLFMPSKKDLLKYVKCEVDTSVSGEDISISKSQNTSFDLINNNEYISQEKLSLNTSKSLLKSSDEFNNMKVKRYVKDSEENVTFFYDCDLSSIENSDAEDDHLTLSFEDAFSSNHRNFKNNFDKMRITRNSSLNDQSKYNKKNKSDLFSKSYDTTTYLENHNSSIDFLNDHKYYEKFCGKMSKKKNCHDCEVPIKDNIQCHSVYSSINPCKLNPKNNALESLNYSNVKTISECKKFEFSDRDITVDVDSLYEDHSRDNCNTKMNNISELKKFKPLDNRDISDETSDLEKSIASYKTVNKSSKDIKSQHFNQLNVKSSGSSTVPKYNVVDTIDIIDLDSWCEDHNEIVEKPGIKKLDEILDKDESVSPIISQSVVKTINSENLKNALSIKATYNLNIQDMGNQALCTYLTQLALVVDVLNILRKSIHTCPLSDVLMDDPKGLMVPLMPHQKYAVAWLIWRESMTPFGGILADDMGLGKTLSMISLVLKSEEKQTGVPLVPNNSSKNDIVNGGTLVVCPVSLLNQWENELRTKLSPGLLKVGQYYGVKRSMSTSELVKNDIVTTSYHVIMWDFKKQPNSSPLFKINWKRIILDEAHVIRNYKAQTCIAVCNLMSMRRWAITGTPIHNKEADFFTLLKFIRCKPFDDWTIWKRYVGNNDNTGRHVQSLLVKSLMLRRTKEELSQLISFKLPGKNVSTIDIELSKEERNAYEQLLKFSSKLFATYLYDKVSKEKVFDHSKKVQCTVQYFHEQSKKKEEMFKDHPELQKLFNQFNNIKEIQTYHILVLLLRLRQMCCHPCLIKGTVTEENIGNDEIDFVLDGENTTYNNAIESASCNEKFDTVPTEDLNPIEELTNNMSCLTGNESECSLKNNLIDSNLIFKTSWLSSKIKAVCDMVREKVLINDCKEKAIIVSQWPSMLRIIRKHLSEYDCEMEMYSGDLSMLNKNSIVREFNNINGGPQILLLSLKAGGVGLNLMAANHLFLVDIHWNPQLEAQACDRIYRLGQMKPVHIYKFVCVNTIETRIVMIQSHKLKIAQNLFAGVKVNSSKITEDDLKHIFQCT